MADSKGKQSKFEMVIGAVDRFSKVFSGFNDKLDKGRAGVERLENSVKGLNKATGFSRLAGAVSGVGGSMKNVADEGKNLAATVTGLAGKFSLVFGAAGGGLFALAKSTANAGDAAAKAAARAGVGVRTWQEYAHAANLSAVSGEQLEKSFVKLQDIAIKAFKGDKTQSGLLKLAGIDPRTAKGEIKNADSIFLELADKVKALQDAGQGAKAVNLVKSILGDEGTKLMPMLSGGAAGLKDMRLEAHKLGLVLSEDDAKASEGFNDGLAKMLASLKGIGYSIGKVLLPPLTKLMAKFTDWFAAQREIISGGFAEWIEKLDVDKIWRSIESGMGKLADLGRTVNGLAQSFGGWENVLVAVAGIIGGKFLLSIGSLVASFGKLGFAIMTTPVGWFIAACAAIGAAVYAIYKNWDSIVSYFQGLWQGVKDAFSRNWLEGIVKFLVDFNPLRLILKGMNELLAYFTGIDLLESGANLVDSFGKGISDAWQDLMNWFTEKLKVFTDAWNKVKGFFGVGGDDAGGVSVSDDAGGYQPSARKAETPARRRTRDEWTWNGEDGGAAAPLNMGADARGVAETRTEHVEKNELTITVQAENGAGAQVNGSGGSGVSWELGYQAHGML